MKKQNSKKLFKTMGACLLVGVIGASTLVGCATSQETTSKENLNIPGFENILQSSENIEGVSVIPEESNVIKLFSSEPVVVNEENQVYVEQTITATVLPLDTPYQNVTWELSWETEQDDNVLDYVTITPSETNSKILTLRCYQAFLGRNMRLVCKTEVGGFSTYATVSYYGKPTSFYLASRPALTKDENVPTGYYNLTSGTTYETEICLQNVLGVVNPDFQPEYNVEITAHGNFISSGIIVNNMVGMNTIKSMDFMGIKFDMTKAYFFFNFGEKEYDIAKISVEGNFLKIEALNSFDEIGSTLIDFPSNKPLTENDFIFFTLTLKEIKSGLKKNYNFRIVSAVSSAALESNDVEF